MNYLPSKATAKAIVAAVVTLCAYLAGILNEDQGLGDVTTLQWLGAVVFLGTAYGLTYATPNAARYSAGQHRSDEV